MPKDRIALGFESVFAKEIEEADAWIKQNAPEVAEGKSPSEYRALLRDTARENYRKRALESGGFGGFVKSEIVNRLPNETGELGLRFLDPGNRIVEGASLEGAGKLASGALDLFGAGPESIAKDPVGGAGALGGLAASIAVPPIAAARVPQMFARTGVGQAITRLEQILTPAAAATAAGTGAAISINSDDGNTHDDFFDYLNAGLEQGRAEAFGGAVGQGLVLARRAANRFIRGNQNFFDDSLEALRLAGIRGEEVSIENVTDRAIISSGRRTIGVMPIPIFATRFSRSAERSSDAMRRVQTEMFDTASPVFSTIRQLRRANPDAADRLLRARSEQVFRDVAGAVDLYRRRRSRLDAFITREFQNPNLVSAGASVRGTALLQMRAQAAASTLPSRTGQAGTLQPIERANPLSPAAQKHLDDILNLRRGAVGLAQLQNLRKDIRKTIASTDPNQQLDIESRGVLQSLEAAIDNDIEQAVNVSGNRGLITAYTRLRDSDQTWINLLEGHVGARGKRVQTTFGMEALSEAGGRSVGIQVGERGIQRRQGPLDMGEFLDDLLDDASPEEVRQLGFMLRSQGRSGRESLGFAYARQLDKMIGSVAKTATDANIQVIKADRIRSFIEGKDGQSSQQAQRFWAIAEESGVGREQVERFTRAAEVLWRQVPSDPNQFLTRSVILSGGKNLPQKMLRLMSAGLFGAASAGGAVVAPVPTIGAQILGIVMLDKYSRIATSPKALADLQKVLNPEFGTGIRQRALERFVASSVFREWTDEKMQGISAEIDNGLNVINQALPNFGTGGVQ